MPIGYGVERSARAYCSGTYGCRNAIELTVKVKDSDLAQQVANYDGSREEVAAWFPSGHGGDWKAMALSWVGRDGDRDVFQGRILLGAPGWSPGQRMVESVTIDAINKYGVAFSVSGNNSATGRSFFEWAQDFAQNVKPAA